MVRSLGDLGSVMVLFLLSSEPEWLRNVEEKKEGRHQIAHSRRTENVFDGTLVPSGGNAFTCQYRSEPASTP